MANRAYLYCRNGDELDFKHPRKYYYDSRHNIPVAWFFFFSLNDIRIFDVHYRVSSWAEVKFITQKEAVLTLFNRRRSLLDRLIGTQIDNNKIVELLADLDRWSGDYLVLDPAEVLGNDDQWHAEQFADILSCINQSETDPLLTELIDKLGQCSNLFPEEPSKIAVNFVGVTYCWDEKN